MQQKGQGNHVVLGARQKDKRVLVWVEDDGPGMTPDQLDRVFKPFYTTKPKGLGVGLSLAKRIIERFGGEIAVFSTAGKGAIVEISLIAAEQEKEA
jgi:signal transduction histidine kinase